MSFLDRIREINRHDSSAYMDFVVDGSVLGRVRRDRVAILLKSSPLLRRGKGETIEFQADFTTVEARSAGMAAAAETLEAAGHIPALRAELYPATWNFGDPPRFVIDRSAVPFFGLRAWGVHVNGYTWKNGRLHMWIGRRADDKPTYPGMLDNMVAGGQPTGLGLIENLIKECAEEADIPADLARQARPVGAITYIQEAPEGLKPDVQFCFDLELPPDFRPRNTDGEIADFFLWPIEKVAKTVAKTRSFKFNCNLVIIDFLIRNGVIPPDDRDYVALVQGLHP